MKKPLVILFILCLVVGIPVLKKLTGSSDVKTVQVEALGEHNIQSSIIASGNLSHEEKVLLSTEVIGNVKAIYVKEGDSVTRGQLVLQVDDETFVSAVEQSQAAVRMQKIAIERAQLRLDNSRLQWQRNKILFDKKIINQDFYDTIVLELAAAELELKSGGEALIQSQAQLAQAENNLTKTRVYSPIEGVVTSLNIKVGETAIAGTMNYAGSSLMTIANPASLHTEVNVDEADIANVALGQRAEIVAIAHPDQPIAGVVDFIAETAKVAAGRNGLSFAIKIRFDDITNIKLWPGMSARAEIFTRAEATRLAVPIQAIVNQTDKADATSDAVADDENENEKSYVFLLKDGKAQRVAVTLGVADDEYQEVAEKINSNSDESGASTGELAKGASIILGPDRILRHLKDGDSVVVDADLSKKGT